MKHTTMVASIPYSNNFETTCFTFEDHTRSVTFDPASKYTNNLLHIFSTQFELLNSLEQPYRCRKEENYPRPASLPSCIWARRCRGECIRGHTCRWWCFQRSGPGRWPWSQTGAPQGPHSERAQNLKDIMTVRFKWWLIHQEMSIFS